MTRAAVYLAFGVLCAWPQTTFEVASIKPSGKGQLIDVFGMVIPLGMRGGPGTANPGQITFPNASLKTMIAVAYGVKRYQVSGPDWLDTAGFDVIAKIAPDVIAKAAPEVSKEQALLMVRNMLAERFGLVVHIEKNNLPVYDLVVGKGGVKLQPSQADPEAGGTVGSQGGYAYYFSPHTTFQQMTDYLSPRLDRPVIDKTGVTVKYDIELKWDAENLDSRLRAHRDEAAEPAPTIFGAVQLLGLRLEPSKSAMDVVVIDHVEKSPSEN